MKMRGDEDVWQWWKINRWVLRVMRDFESERECVCVCVCVFFFFFNNNI